MITNIWLALICVSLVCLYWKYANSPKTIEEAKVKEIYKEVMNDLFRATDTVFAQGITELRETIDLAETVDKLRKEKAQLEIDKSKVEEEFKRERREIEHKLGLEKKRQEQELEFATRDAQLKAKEDNLQNERELFKKEMNFNMDRFKAEVEYQRELSEKLLAMLPKMTIKQEIKNGD